MKKFLLTIFVLCFCLVGCGNNDNNLQNTKEENNDYNVSRTTTTNEINTENTITDSKPKTTVETDIASFSTKIYTPNDEARQNNITLTCSKLNGTIVKARRNFFFL